MKKYIIEVFRHITVVEYGGLEVEAESLEDAKKKGLQMFADGTAGDARYTLGDTVGTEPWEIDHEHTNRITPRR